MRIQLPNQVDGLDQMLTSTQVRCLVGVSARQLQRLIDSEVVPSPDAFLGKARRWRKSTIEQFLTECVAKA